jgi:putative intracellular protease/amidase
MNFVEITPQYTIADCPKPDIVVVPGGAVPSDNLALRKWVTDRSKDTELVMSVCNGAMLLGSSGLLAGLEVTTHHSALQSLALVEPTAKVVTNRRFVDNGRILTSGGISAGIDSSLHVVARMWGEDVAWETARYMEYDWRPDEIAKLHEQPGREIEDHDALRWVGAVKKLGLDKALAEYRAMAKPPTEKQMNMWGYTLMRSQRADDATALLGLVAAAFPASANAADSWSEALEAKGERDPAARAAKDCLARLEKDPSVTPESKKLLANAASSRIARLSGKSASEMPFVCPPCGSACDNVGYLEGGKCPNCSMQLVRRDGKVAQEVHAGKQD